MEPCVGGLVCGMESQESLVELDRFELWRIGIDGFGIPREELVGRSQGC